MDILNFDAAVDQGDALLTRYDSALDRDEALDKVVTEMAGELRDWISQVRKLGIRIGSHDDRQRLQGRINYWTSVLSRFGEFSGSGEMAAYDESVGEDLPDHPCPYPGLRPCREGDVFEGRKSDVKDFCDHILQHGLLVIVGRSGTGKSSIVIAGMLPFLAKAEASADWLRLRRGADPPQPALPGEAPSAPQDTAGLIGMTPGTRPLHSLVSIVGDAAGRADDAAWQASAAARLLAAPDQAAAWLAETLPNRQVFLFVDQFEELFSLCSDVQQRFAFQGALLSMLSTQPLQHHVVLTMRTDHLDVFEKMFPDLYALAILNMRKPSKMTLSDLVRVIQEPANRLKPARLLFSPASLVDKLARDTEPLVSGLPLLQFALTKLWKHRLRDKITQKSYDLLPTVQDSLANAAGGLYEQFNEAEQLLCRRMMIELAVIVGFEEPLRRRVRQADLVQRLRHESAGGDAMVVIDAFFDAGLVVRTGRGDELQIEVAHEALFRNWALFFEEWLPAEKNDILLRQRIDSDAQEWRIAVQQEASNSGQGAVAHSDDLLSLKGDRLQAALRLQGARRLDAQAEAFVKACSELSESQRRREDKAAQAEEAAKNERAAAQAERQKVTSLSIALGALVLVGVAVGVASYFWYGADLVQRLSLAAEVSANGKPTRALDVAYTQSIEMQSRWRPAGNQSREARAMLSRALYATDDWTIFEERDVGGTFSTSGRHFIQLKTDGEAPFWRVSTVKDEVSQQALTLTGKGKGTDLTELAISDVTPDGRFAVLVWAKPPVDKKDGVVSLSVWICPLNWVILNVDCPTAAHHNVPGSDLVSMAMAADGSRYLIATGERQKFGATVASSVTLFVLDQASPSPSKSIRLAPSEQITAIGLTVSGALIYGHADGTVTPADGQRTTALDQAAPVQKIFISYNKDQFLSLDAVESLTDWNVIKAQRTELIKGKGKGSVTSARYDQVGERVVALVDSTVHCWVIMAGNWHKYDCDGGTPVSQAAFADDPNFLSLAKDKDIGALTRSLVYPVRNLGIWVAGPAGALTYPSGLTWRDCPLFHQGPSEKRIAPGVFEIPGLCDVKHTDLAPPAERIERIFNAAPTADGRWLAFAKAKLGSAQVPLGPDDLQTIGVVAAGSGKMAIELFKLPSKKPLSKLAVAVQAVDKRTELIVGAATGDELHYATVDPTMPTTVRISEPYRLRGKEGSQPDWFSCLAFSADGQRLVAGTAFGKVYSGSLGIKGWEFVARVDDPKRPIPATISACSINAKDGIVVGTAGGDVFRIEGRSNLRMITRELLRFDSGVESVVIYDDGRIAALAHRPEQGGKDGRTATSGQKQRVLVWQPDKKADELAADLLMAAPVFAVSVSPKSISTLTDHGWVTHPCHGCEPSLDELIKAAEKRKAKKMTPEQLDQLAGKTRSVGLQKGSS